METAQQNDIFDIFGNGSAEDVPRMSANAAKVAVPWVEKYRPHNLDDLVINEDTRRMFKDMVATGDLADMSLCGSPGIGKSTIARMLPRLVNAEVKFIPCGTDGTVDIVRDQIRPFCESASSGRIKCVILDEFDAASGGNAASNGMQKALRSLMEAFTDTRFIITCNYPKKIIEAIFSRCQKVNIGFTLKDVANRLKTIWEKEGVQYTRETAVEFMKKYAAPKMPDVRSIINTAYMMSTSGTLVPSEDSQLNVVSTALSAFGREIVDSIAKGVDYRTIRRQLVASSSLYNGDHELMASAMADAIVEGGYSASAIPVIAEASYRMSQVHDPSLQLAALILKLNPILTRR